VRAVPPPLCTRSSVLNGRAIPTHAARSSLSRTLALAVATGGGAGYSPVASGTAGAAVGAALFWSLAALPLALYAVTVVGVTCLGIWAADLAEREWGTKDDGRIVIDEIAGQLITLLPLLVLGRARSLGWIVTGFVAFRVFDVWKPGPARWLEENLEGGAGVVLDDVAAGVFAALVLVVMILGSRLA
jgi:phosphatidylglycerophosphatase A